MGEEHKMRKRDGKGHQSAVVDLVPGHSPTPPHQPTADRRTPEMVGRRVIPGRSPTPPHQPTAGRQTPEAVGCRVLLGSAGGSLRRTAPCQMPQSPSVGSESSPTSGGRRRGPQPVMQTAEDEIQAVLQSAGVVQYLQRWRLLAITLTCRCRRTVQMQVLRQHTDGRANQRRLDKLTNEGTDGKREGLPTVNVTITCMPWR
nr:unnamed protein product [Spirometra erinaceieuropaei]